jgi:hypothetical protein
MSPTAQFLLRYLRLNLSEAARAAMTVSIAVLIMVRHSHVRLYLFPEAARATLLQRRAPGGGGAALRGQTRGRLRAGPGGSPGGARLGASGRYAWRGPKRPPRRGGKSYPQRPTGGVDVDATSLGECSCHYTAPYITVTLALTDCEWLTALHDVRFLLEVRPLCAS